MGRSLSRFWVGLFLAILFVPVQGESFLINEWERMDSDSGTVDPTAFPKQGKPWQDSLTGMVFLWIPGGCYMMGSPPYAHGRDADEGPIHEVCLTGFWMGQKEVTQEQWRSIMRVNPALFSKGDNYPVEQVSWDDVEVLTNQLNAKYSGKASFRLPTEAEWEYACRERGQKIVFPVDAEPRQFAWFSANSAGSTQPTGTKKANRLGLMDMGGNVGEWVEDSYAENAYALHKREDPHFKSGGPFRGVRGGGWQDPESALRCANRGFARFSSRKSDLGFRLVAVVGTEARDESWPNFSKMPF